MSSNIREFNLAIAREVALVPERIGKVHRALALEAVASIVRMTPVDTGRARANWSVSHDTPSQGSSDATDQSGGATIAAAAAQVANIQPYEITWIANNLPYIEQLEKGSSKQAPAGMVAVTAARLSGMRRIPGAE